LFQCKTVKNDDSPQPRKKQKRLKNHAKNAANHEKVHKMFIMLDAKYRKFLAQYPERRSLCYRLAHLHCDCQWDKKRLQSFLRDNYMAFDIKQSIDDKQKLTYFDTINLNKMEINRITKNISNSTASSQPNFDQTPSKPKCTAISSKYYDYVFSQQMKQAMNESLNDSGPTNTNSGISAEKESDSTIFNANLQSVLIENEKLKKEMEEFRKYKKEKSVFEENNKLREELKALKQSNEATEDQPSTTPN